MSGWHYDENGNAYWLSSAQEQVEGTGPGDPVLPSTFQGTTTGGPGGGSYTSPATLGLIDNLAQQIARLTAAADAGNRQAAVSLAELYQRTRKAELDTGLGILGLVASLGGPKDAYSQQAVLGGIGKNGMLNAVNAIAGQYKMPSFQALQGTPEPMTMDTLLKQIGATPNTTPVPSIPSLVRPAAPAAAPAAPVRSGAPAAVTPATGFPPGTQQQTRPIDSTPAVPTQPYWGNPSVGGGMKEVTGTPIGYTEGGYRFIGGDAGDKNQWVNLVSGETEAEEEDENGAYDGAFFGDGPPRSVMIHPPEMVVPVGRPAPNLWRDLRQQAMQRPFRAA